MIGDPTRTSGLSHGEGRTDLFAYPFFERFRERNRVFTDVYAPGRCEHLDVAVANGSAIAGKDLQPRGRFVTGNYFSLLGVSPLIGRTFTEDGSRTRGAAPVVVISYGYWERQFARNLNVIGQKLLVNGTSFTVIGVTPPDFGDIVGVPYDMWFPITMQEQANPGHDYMKDPRVSWLLLMGRLKPGVLLGQAKAAVQALSGQIFTELYSPLAPADQFQRLLKEQIEVSPGAKGFSRLRHDFSTPLAILMSVVALVLLICCANVANLQLARAANRSTETSVRLAVGAGQARLIRQLLTESLLISISGGALGLLLAFWGSHALLGLVSQLVYQSDQLPVRVPLDRNVLLFTASVPIFAALLSGLVPALQSTRVDLISNLKDSKSRGTQRSSLIFGKALIISQIVFSLVLLVSAGLFIRTLQNLRNVDVGYVRQGLLLAELDFKTVGYQGNTINQLTRQLLEKVQQLPGVRAASVSENGLFSGTDSTSNDDIEGYTPQSFQDKANQSDRVGPNYFEVVGTPVLAGRGIELQDVENSQRAAVINEKMARFYFPHDNPIGKHIFDPEERIAYSIVGVVRDTKQNHLRAPTPRRFYTAYLQPSQDPMEALNLEIRTRIPSARVTEAVRRAIKSVNPNLPILSLKSADALIDGSLEQEKLIARLSGFFGLLALILAAIGLYGVISHLTVRRTTEIGIRIALGAERFGVIALVVRDAFRLLLAGLTMGTVLSLFAARVLGQTLFGPSPFDPATILVSVGAVTIVVMLATYLPAWRASRIDPMRALRYS
jgi:predicted permease